MTDELSGRTSGPPDGAPSGSMRGPSASLPRRRSGITVWKQIASVLEQEIRDRCYAAEGCLPSEPALAARFGVARHTLRQALAALRDAGLLRIEQGKGAFVQTAWLDYTLQRRTRYSENMLRNQLQPSRQLVSACEESASPPVAEALGLRKGARVLVAELLQSADEQPVAKATMYFPADRLAGLLELLAQGRSVTEALAEKGIADYRRAHSCITAHMPDQGLARLLNQPVTRPVLCVVSVDADLQGVPIKYGTTLFSADRVQLLVDEQERHG